MEKQQTLTLGIDTSCDETSIAILEGDKKILANVISSQIKLHQSFGGVVPELASRSHTENILPVFHEALAKAGISLKDITGMAVTASPGLIGCLLVGLSFAKSLSYANKIPLTVVHHIKGHLFSPFLENDEIFPFIGLVVSGGHTALYYVESFDQIKPLGHTVDDAAGEAYDKVAKIMGLGYPGGPIVDKLAKEGNPESFKFTRARVKKGPFLFSFSGLKTAVSLIVEKEFDGNNTLTPGFSHDLCASFQKEVVETLLEKLDLGLKEFPAKAVLLSGGVAVNSLLRSRLQQFCEERKILGLRPSPILCTDNAAMIAYVGKKQLDRGLVADLSANAFASKPMW